MTAFALYVFFGFAVVVWGACVFKIKREGALLVMMFWPMVLLISVVIWVLRR